MKRAVSVQRHDVAVGVGAHGVNGTGHGVCVAPLGLGGGQRGNFALDHAARGVLPLEGDRAFHSAIVQACGNAVLIDTVEQFWDSRRGPLFERLGGYFETVKSWKAAIVEHEAIQEAIRARDAAQARLAMHTHMDKSHARFSASWRRAKKSGS